MPDAARTPDWQRFVPWLCAGIAFAIAARKLIGGYGDLGIYLDVAREFQAGGVDLCRARQGSGPWVYPHFAALPFVVLEATLGDAGARWVWCAGMGLATALLLRSVARCMAAVGGLGPWQWLAFGVLFQRCIAQNLSHGQLSLWVATFATLGIAALVRGRELRAGCLLGIAAALKLTPLLFVFALPLMGRSRAAVAMATTVAVAVLLVPWPFCGTDEHLRHLADFWQVTAQALAGSGSAIVEYAAGPSIKGTLDYLLQARPVDDEGHVVNIVDLGDRALSIAKLIWSLVLGALLLAWFWSARRLATAERLVQQAGVVLLTMSFFAPVLRIYHLAAILIPGALFCRGPRDRRDWLWHGTTTALLFAMTLRQKNLIGETLWRVFDVGGLLHFALIAMCLWLWRDTLRRGA